MIRNKKAMVLMGHLAGWFLGIAMVIAFLISNTQDGRNVSAIIVSWSLAFFVLFYVCIFYLNLKVLLPLFFLRKRYLLYGTGILILVITVFYLKPFERLMQAGRMQRTEIQPPPGMRRPPPDLRREARPVVAPGLLMQREPGRPHFDLMSMILFLVVWSVSSIIVVSAQWRQTENKNALIKMDKAQAELAFLKAQVSPHFLFNTLNNIYALAVSKSDKTASGILRLSNIMRYITDEAPLQFVPVEKEISCINDFIELQKMRLGRTAHLEYTLTGGYDGLLIAPLIFMPFVENVFKHGISKNAPSELKISIDVNPEWIHLRTENRVPELRSKDKREGVGLENVKHRLQLLYPGTHYLEIKNPGDSFVVDLKLKPVYPHD